MPSISRLTRGSCGGWSGVGMRCPWEGPRAKELPALVLSASRLSWKPCVRSRLRWVSVAGCVSLEYSVSAGSSWSCGPSFPPGEAAPEGFRCGNDGIPPRRNLLRSFAKFVGVLRRRGSRPGARGGVSEKQLGWRRGTSRPDGVWRSVFPSVRAVAQRFPRVLPRRAESSPHSLERRLIRPDGRLDLWRERRARCLAPPIREALWQRRVGRRRQAR